MQSQRLSVACGHRPFGVRLPTYNEGEIGFPGIVGKDKSRLLPASMAGLWIQTDGYSSLASGRDRLVEVGDGTASAGQDFLDLQFRRSRIPDGKVVDIILSFGHLSKVMECFWNFRTGSGWSGGRYGGRCSGQVRRSFSSPSWTCEKDRTNDPCEHESERSRHADIPPCLESFVSPAGDCGPARHADRWNRPRCRGFLLA